jgi:hypothetical protein
MNDEIKGKVKSGKARAEVLSPERRKEIAQKAAAARWSEAIIKATHGSPDKPLKIGDFEIPCYVLEDGTRVVSERGITKALGGKRGGSHWKRIKENPSGAYLPVYLSANNLKPYINNELSLALSKPIRFQTTSGLIAFGIDAQLLPDICNVWLNARDAGAIKGGQKHIADMADILMRGFAKVGIIALIDEATGYHKDKAKEEYAKILEAFVAKELQPYVKTFQYDYYEQMFRLRGLTFPPGNGVKRPQYFGHLTNDIVYRRLAPGVWKELKEQTEKDEKGRLKHKLFQKLTPNIGHPKLRDLLSSVITIMKLSEQWGDFKIKLDKIHPAYNETMMLPFELENDNGKGL